MKKKLIKKLLTAAVVMTLTTSSFIPAQASTVEQAVTTKDSYNYYFGVPHAHTSFSDGGGTATPEQAYEYAKSTSKMDYLFISDHSNLLNGNEFGEYNEARNEFEEKEGSEWYLIGKHAKEATTDSFLGGRGFEMTSSATNGGENYGHINVYNTDTYVEAAETMQNLDDFYKWLDEQEGAIGYFNHPNRPESSFNYLKYVEELDDKIQMIEVGNGSMGSNYLDSTDYYYKALDYGWHLAPTNGQDNHATNWGDADNMTAIIAKSLSLEDVYDAMRNRRVYSTETRNLKLEVYANGQIMGSELEMEKGDSIHFDIKASDPEDKITKIEIITNGGRTIAEKKFKPSNSVSFKKDITVSEGKNWYVVKVTHEDGRVAIGSANYAEVSDQDVKLLNLHLSSEFISLNSETEASVQLINAGETSFGKGAVIDFYFNDEKIGTHKITKTLKPGDADTYNVKFTPKGESGTAYVRAVLTIDAESSVRELTHEFTVIEPNGKKVVFDSAHKNIGVVNGTMLEFSEVLRLFGYQVEFNTEEITAEMLKDVDVLILNTPTKDTEGKPSNKLTDAEETAVAAFVKNGGGLLYSTQSADQYKYDATQYNTLLEKLGSDIRFNFDGIHESEEEHQDNKNVQSFYAKTYPNASLGINDDMYALRIYRGGSLVDAEGTALTNKDGKNLEILAAANETSYTGTVGEGGYAYATADEKNGDIIPLVAAQKIEKGNIVVSGRYAYSNYEIGNDASNGAFFLKVVDYLANLDNYTSVTKIKKVKDGDCVSIEGVITKGEARANTFWLKDTNGKKIAVIGQQTGSLPLEEGTRVIVNGKVSTVAGEKVIEYQSYTHQIQYVGMSSDDTEEIEATRFTAKSKVTTLRGKKAVKVSWNAPEEVELDGYQVFRSTKRNSGFGKKPICTTEKTSYYNTKLKTGTRYYYKVRGFKEIDGERVYTQWSNKVWRTV